MEAVPPPTEPTLPADRTFVVQFGSGAGGNGDATARGRIEHLVSGTTARFETWSELRGFVERMLHAPAAQPAEGQP